MYDFENCLSKHIFLGFKLKQLLQITKTEIKTSNPKQYVSKMVIKKSLKLIPRPVHCLKRENMVQQCSKLFYFMFKILVGSTAITTTNKLNNVK